MPADGLYQSGAVGGRRRALHDVMGGDADAVVIGHDWGARRRRTRAAAFEPDRWRRIVTMADPAGRRRRRLPVPRPPVAAVLVHVLLPEPARRRRGRDGRPGASSTACGPSGRPGTRRPATDLPAVKDALRAPENLARLRSATIRVDVGTPTRQPGRWPPRRPPCWRLPTAAAPVPARQRRRLHGRGTGSGAPCVFLPVPGVRDPRSSTAPVTSCTLRTPTPSTAPDVDFVAT